MFINEMALITVAKAKTMTTKIIKRLVPRASDFPFLARRRKSLLIALMIWLSVIACGYWIYRSASATASSTFEQQGLNAVRDLAEKSRRFVLDEDVLSLNLLINDVKTIDYLIFATIVDHENNILSHTNNEMMNQKMRPLGQAISLETIDGTRVIAGLTIERIPVIAFFHTVRFSDVPIGQAVVGLDARARKSAAAAMRYLYGATVALTLVAACIIIVWMDRKKQQKTLQTMQELERAERIGPYVLKDKVAIGGMAELFLADYLREDGFKRKVAIKRIRPHLADNADFINMFTREARLAALLQHPNIVQIFDYGKIDHAYFIAMEYIDGKTLDEILADSKIGMPIDQTVFILSEVCRGLDYSHSRLDDETGKPLHIVHRDISPQNILISYAGEVKISDFGISKARSEPSLTQAGIIKGKLAYMSPEQVLGQKVDQQADIYSLGLVFHEALTGIRVYRFESDLEAIRSIPHRDIEPLTAIHRHFPEALNRIVMKCLAKDKNERYKKAADVYLDLMAFKKSMKISFDTMALAAFMKPRVTAILPRR